MIKRLAGIEPAAPGLGIQCSFTSLHILNFTFTITNLLHIFISGKEVSHYVIA